MARWGRVFLFLVFILVGCVSKLPHVPDYGKTGIGLLALLPVKNLTSDQTAARMVREKMLEELYFKGYPKIPFKTMDEKLLKKYGDNLADGNTPPKAVGELLNVDAAMYCTLSKSKTPVFFFYAPTSIAVSCELRSAKTGEFLWKNRRSEVERNFGFPRRVLKMNVLQVYEKIIQKVVSEIVKTLPDGPLLR